MYLLGSRLGLLNTQHVTTWCLLSDGFISKHWVHQESQARSLVAVAGKDTVRYIL